MIWCESSCSERSHYWTWTTIANNMCAQEELAMHWTTVFTGQGFGPNSGFLILFFFDVGSVTPTRRLTDFNRPGEKKAVYRIDRCDWPRPLESTFISSSHTEISKQAPEKGFFLLRHLIAKHQMAKLKWSKAVEHLLAWTWISSNCN